MRKIMTHKIKGPIINKGRKYERVKRKGAAKSELYSSPVYVNVKSDRQRGF